MKVQNKLLLLCAAALVAFNLLLMWFGRIAALIEQSFKQKQDLIKGFEERQEGGEGSQGSV